MLHELIGCTNTARIEDSTSSTTRKLKVFFWMSAALQTAPFNEKPGLSDQLPFPGSLCYDRVVAKLNIYDGQSAQKCIRPTAVPLSEKGKA